MSNGAAKVKEVLQDLVNQVLEISQNIVVMKAQLDVVETDVKNLLLISKATASRVGVQQDRLEEVASRHGEKLAQHDAQLRLLK